MDDHKLDAFTYIWSSMSGRNYFATEFVMNRTPKKVIINGRTTIVLWEDGTKTRSTCSEADMFDAQIGIAMCLAKKLFGKKKLSRLSQKAVRQQKGG